MSHQIVASELLNELSDEQQQILVGGADFELSGSNYGNRRNGLLGKTNSGPQGSSSVSVGTSNAINTAAQDFLGLGGTIPTSVGALGLSPTGGDPTGGEQTGGEQTGDLGGEQTGGA
ncbi:CTB family bacteriocin [Nostoc sp.]|uniref:CTB family bacteriocin n=1 Tax=Nostoc sp. TaxID=1180 RepID=UPI002FF7A6DD